LIILLLSSTVQSQEDICIGKKHSIYSAVLQEDRSYWVHLPEEYGHEPAQAYPVIYLLDGNSFFHSLVGISKTFSAGKAKILPPSIIVGILNTDRTRDLTPTASAARRDGTITTASAPEGGGAESFNRFLTGELRTVINNTYRTNGQNMLIGHSYGGLFTLYTFLTHTELFDTYLALDPSLWWDQGKLSEQAGELMEGKDFTGKSLYIGIASAKRPGRTENHLNRIDRFLTGALPKAKGLRHYSKSFTDETHGTIAIPGMYDGIKQIYSKLTP